jgi:hypothetical protein
VRLLSTPCLSPQIERVMKVDIRQQRRCHSPYTKGNFEFERVVGGWRSSVSVLDLRLKR